MHLTRATVLLLCVISRGPLLGADGHNPVLPRPQEIKYGGGRLPNSQDRTRARPTRSKSPQTGPKFGQSHRPVCSTVFKRCSNSWKDRARRQRSRKLKFTIGPPLLTAERWWI